MSPSVMAKLATVANQKEWIKKMRQATDGSFVYFTYAVPKSSELFNPYMLKLGSYIMINSLKLTKINY